MDDNLPQDEVEDDAVTGSTEQVDTTNQAQVLLSLEEMIKHHIASIDRLTDDAKKHKQMFADAFENSEAYRESEKKVKEASKDKANVREQILKQPAMQQLGTKIKDINTELKEKKGALSDYLLEYQRLSGSNEIEDLEGQVREIVNNAKLIKRASREVAQSQQGK
jgi:hypothetical protein